MAEIKFSKEEQDILIQKLQSYFSRELAQDIGGFDAQFLLDFIGEEIGSYYYNLGLRDAQMLLAKKLDDISDSISLLEKPLIFDKKYVYSL